jgi:hypothetical protein
MVKLTELISSELSVSIEIIEKGLRQANIRFRKIRVPKKSGGYRTITQPAAELKLIQQWLIERVLNSLPISHIASAFHPGASILKNASEHKRSKYSVRVDLESFFPSIKDVDLLSVIDQHRQQLPDWTENELFIEILSKACFDSQKKLPIGYSTSPIIANIVMHNFDNQLYDLLNSNKEQFGQFKLTRYADDFIFSSDLKGACKAFVEVIHRLCKSILSPTLTINEKKTRYMSRMGGSTLITGLRINQQGNVRVHANYRDHVRLLLKHYSAGKLNAEESQKLIGHLAYLENVDSKLFTRLCFKYFLDISKLRGYK